MLFHTSDTRFHYSDLRFSVSPFLPFTSYPTKVKENFPQSLPHFVDQVLAIDFQRVQGHEDTIFQEILNFFFFSFPPSSSFPNICLTLLPPSSFLVSQMKRFRRKSVLKEAISFISGGKKSTLDEMVDGSFAVDLVLIQKKAKLLNPQFKCSNSWFYV